MAEYDFPTKKEYDTIVSTMFKINLGCVKRGAIMGLAQRLNTGMTDMTIYSRHHNCDIIPFSYSHKIIEQTAEYLINEMKSRGYQPKYDTRTCTLSW
jgi:hypothetical protein